MKIFYVPLYRNAVSYLVNIGRRWSLLEQLLLIELGGGRRTVKQLALSASLPERLIVEALINLMQAGWIEVVSTGDTVVFDTTVIGKRRSSERDLPVKLYNRAADLALITALALVVFSEQLLSRFIRIVWLRAKAEGMYEDAYAIIQSAQKASSAQFRARVIDCLLRYETAKALAGISLSTKVFRRLNPALSEEWRQTADALQIPREDGVLGELI